MPFADELLGRGPALQLLASLEHATGRDDLDAVAEAARSLTGLALRERSDLLADALLHDVGTDCAGLEKVYRRAMEDDAFRGWLIWPVTESVVRAALLDGGAAAFDAALDLLADLTGRLTAEFAIRGLLAADLPRALPKIMEWTRSPDAGVRRLASEGTRPRLPWARRVAAILAQPRVTVPILDALYQDPDEVVRRSVANHLNDISRAAPGVATDTAARWLAEPDRHTPALVRHALRTLVKQGDQTAMALLGFAPAPQVGVTGPHVRTPTVAVGQDLEFTLTLHNAGAAPATLAIDYVVHYRKADGTLRPKVFKLSTRTLQPDETLTLTRRQSFKKITTRVLYPGEHAVQVQVNGVLAAGRATFELISDGPAAAARQPGDPGELEV